MLRFHIKLIHPKVQWKSLAWLIIQKKKHICFADSHIFFRVHLHLKQIPYASGLAQKQPPTAPNTIHDKRWRALFAEVQQSFFFPGVVTFNYCVNKDIFEPSDWQSAGSSVSRSISQWNHKSASDRSVCCAHISKGDIYKWHASRADAADTSVQFFLNNAAHGHTQHNMWRKPERDDELISTAASDTFVRFLSKGL